MMNDVASRKTQQPDTVEPMLKAKLAERKARWPAEDKARQETVKKRNMELKETLFHQCKLSGDEDTEDMVRLLEKLYTTFDFEGFFPVKRSVDFLAIQVVIDGNLWRKGV